MLHTWAYQNASGPTFKRVNLKFQSDPLRNSSHNLHYTSLQRVPHIGTPTVTRFLAMPRSQLTGMPQCDWNGDLSKGDLFWKRREVARREAASMEAMEVASPQEMPWHCHGNEWLLAVTASNSEWVRTVSKYGFQWSFTAFVTSIDTRPRIPLILVNKFQKWLRVAYHVFWYPGCRVIDIDK